MTHVKRPISNVTCKQNRKLINRSSKVNFFVFFLFIALCRGLQTEWTDSRPQVVSNRSNRKIAIKPDATNPNLKKGSDRDL